ncbi:MAG: hypothetical protein ACI3YC_08615 [Alloprevotella sp.]
MTLHIYNPSHEEALTANTPYYYPSLAARSQRQRFGALPALWAAPGDAVWVEEDGCLPDSPLFAGVRFVTRRDLRPAFWEEVERIEPWGWDLLVRHSLRKVGAPERLLPTDEQLASVRRLSSRETVAPVLQALRRLSVPTVGESVVCRSEEEVRERMEVWGDVMVKSLWSCSGRGIVRLSPSSPDSLWRRVGKWLAAQGGAEVEPAYDKLADFALEFDINLESDIAEARRVTCCGLSFFDASRAGAYSGNHVASPETLLRLLSEKAGKDVEAEVAAAAKAAETVLADVLAPHHVGPVGIDMMYVLSGGVPVLHPCVELNLRRTMGRVASDLWQRLAAQGVYTGCSQLIQGFAGDPKLELFYDNRGNFGQLFLVV